MTVLRSFSLTEKALFGLFSAILAASAFALLFQVNKLFLVEVPDYGGTLTEGVLGTPRFINPLLAASDVDKDLTALVYSGLLKTDSDGDLVPDLAASYSISDDSLMYTFTLKDDAYFSDGTKVTADDVVFTVEKAQDDALKSPRQASFAGVKVEKIDEKTVAFSLKQPYAPFIQNLTMGILPLHIWKNVSNEEFPYSQFNTKPIGSGPYEVDAISYTSSGLPSEYRLKAFSKYALGEPYITNIVLKSYQSESDEIAAYKSGKIDSLHSISPKDLPSVKLADDAVALSPLPRIFGVFFNQNVQPIFVNKEVRQALDAATDKQAVIDTVLQGYGIVIDGPVPAATAPASDGLTEDERIAQAKSILEKAGWKLNEDGIYQKKDKTGTQTLSFSISTGNATELKDAAYLLQRQWQAIGANVEVKVFEIGDLNQNVIKPRKYDSLLFGEVVGRDLDLYPFWHSSQRNAPGLNIASYTNLKVDKLLENLRATTDPVERQSYFDSFEKEIQNDVPAVFIYSPDFIYILPKTVHDAKIGSITQPSERWNDVGEWYIETNSVWRIFAKRDNAAKTTNQN
jgi:peptide/nickel transport system substrate-binding protein